MDRREYKVLCEIFRARESSLRRAMEGILRHFYSEEDVYSTVDYVYAVGSIPVTLVAHLDTVHKFPPYEIFKDPDKGVIWSPEGIGADDRAGVFGIYKLIQSGLRPSVILCTQEEVGGLGAYSFVKDYPSPLVPTNFIIELDRCGSNDMVFYDCDNVEFEKYIGSFGFEKHYGSFSDISIIAPTWGIAAVNLSIGYEDEHTYSERLYYRDMYNTIDKVRKILKDKNQPAFNYIPAARWDKSYKVDAKTGNTMIRCDCCEAWVPEDSTVTVNDAEGFQWALCNKCADSYTNTCRVCGQRFMTWGENYTLCPHCTGGEIIPE